ncbi:MAG: methionine--tRNA ligase [Patescibacteria group bacterium]
MKTFFVTTPIYYVNDRPHIGHAYTTVVADAMARLRRLRGDMVAFSTGVDENSQKNVQAMAKTGETDLGRYLDTMADVWKTTWASFGLSEHAFIRTTSPEHRVAVERFWKAAMASGDIYLAEYQGLYCTGCEAFKTETEVVNGTCPLHPNADLQNITERNYFFRASSYRDALLKLYEDRPDFVMPDARRNEIRNYVKDHFADFSVSRDAKNLEVGLPVPDDPSQRIYVWFDALINYATVAGFGTDDNNFADVWPPDLHLVGKDIIKFHCALWPAMIMSAAKNDPLLRDADGNTKLPRRVFAHGFFTIDGKKISKSLGNAIDPVELAKEYGDIGIDVLRYFLLRDIPFGEDGDFSRERLKERYVHDLANTLGNLLNRAVAMSRKYFGNKVPASLSHEASYTFADERGIEALRKAFDGHTDDVRFDLALETVWNGIGSGDDRRFGLLQANKFIEDTKPFQLAKTDLDATGVILYSLLEYCRNVAWLLEPVMPEVSRRIIAQLGQDPDIERTKGVDDLLSWGGLKPGTDLPEPSILFPPVDHP